MTLPDSDKSTYVLGLLLTVLGWHITQLTQEIRSTHAVAYWIDRAPAGDQEEITLQNVSTSKSVQQLPVQISCLNGEACITDGDMDFRSYPPTLTPALPMVTELQPAHLFHVTLAAGGKLGIVLKCKPKLGCPDFYIKPDENKPLEIFVLEGRSLRGFFVLHYFEITVVSLLLAIAGLLAVIYYSFREKRRAHVGKSAGRGHRSLHKRALHGRSGKGG